MVKIKENLPVSVARLNPFGVSHSSKADLNRIVTHEISALSIAEYLINHSSKISFIEDDLYP